MGSLPQPDDLTSLVLRIDFSDEVAWNRLRAAIDSCGTQRHATYVSDPAYADMPIQALVDLDAAARDDEKVIYLFCADATTMTDDEQPLLAVDLHTDPGRTFRLPPAWFAEVSANLCIANMDFDEFADYTDASGTYRGFQE